MDLHRYRSICSPCSHVYSAILCLAALRQTPSPEERDSLSRDSRQPADCPASVDVAPTRCADYAATCFHTSLPGITVCRTALRHSSGKHHRMGNQHADNGNMECHIGKRRLAQPPHERPGPDYTRHIHRHGCHYIGLYPHRPFSHNPYNRIGRLCRRSHADFQGHYPRLCFGGTAVAIRYGTQG